ncbi:hypothetical protein M728_005715 (plasmid) [Ensifer sp. WSM1721]|uniref:hypothetical protein n=1 Tax=Ensifer sp. WSM1721 TaxID=1041159 RepID=UPI00047E778F|nr:hypothetical protein [Ensifer sp. WSM1721]
MATVEMSKIDFTAATEWAGLLVAYAEPYSSFLLAVMIAVPSLIALYSGSATSLGEAFVLGLLALFAAGQGESVFVLLLFGMATLVAINGFRRRRDERIRLEMKKDIRDLRTRVDDFLDALDRRTRHLDLALAAATPSRDLSENRGSNEHDGVPTRLHNGSPDSPV